MRTSSPAIAVKYLESLPIRAGAKHSTVITRAEPPVFQYDLIALVAPEN